MENNELKEVIRNYILENKEKMYEAPENDQDDQEDGEEDNGNNIGNTLVKSVDGRNPELDDKLVKVTNPADKLKVLDAFVDYLLNVMGSTNLPQSILRNWALSKFSASTNEEKVDEMSTTAGVPAPATKYAFKLKKKKD